jgi:hypothetical protein
MARRIRFPGLVDIVRVSEPVEIRSANEEPRLDRRFVARGPLLNRLITRRIRKWFTIKGEPLPSLAPRDDAVRSERQRELAAALNPADGHALWTDAQLARLADFVRGEIFREDAAITCQEVVGKLFYANYQADRESCQAAQLIDRFRDGFSPEQILWQISGKLRRARDLLVDRARQDRWAMHGSAIGVHGIVHALERMRDLRASSEATSLDEDAVIGRCLAPPKQVPRTVETMLSTPIAAERLRPGTVVILQLEAAGERAPDAETVFMYGHWNACPAQAFVIALVRAVWRRSLKEDGRNERGRHLHAAAVS